MTPTDKLTVRLAALATLAHDTMPVAGQHVTSILAETERALKRVQRRAEAESLSGEWLRLSYVQEIGPTIEFTGTLLGEDQWTGQQGMNHAIEIWRTRVGALVAVFSTTHPRDGYEAVRVHIAEPGPSGEIAQDQIFALMDAMEWKDRARSLARKLGWSLIREVE